MQLNKLFKDPEANIIYGQAIDETLDEDIVITVIATGFEKMDDTTASILKQLDEQPIWSSKKESVRRNDDVPSSRERESSSVADLVFKLRPN